MAIDDFSYCGQNAIIAKLKNKNLKSVIIPEGIKEIDSFAFSNEYIETIYFPSTLEKICDYAFEYCTHLKKISFHPSCKLKSIGEEAFACCQELTEIKLPDQLEFIGYSAFVNCESLTKVFIPLSVKEIEAYAFEKCNQNLIINIERTRLPSTFNANWNPNYYKVNFTLKDIVIKPSRKTTTQTTVISKPSSINNTINKKPSSTVNTINNTVSKENKSLSNKPINDDLTPFIVDKYFLGGLMLIGVKKEYEDMKEVTIPSSIVAIGNRAFNNTLNLTSVVGHKNLKVLLEDSFKGCTNLKSIKLDKNTNILRYAFANCYNLEEIHLYNELIDEYTFYYSGLKKVTFDNLVKSIQSHAFYACKLENLYLPDSIEYIGSEAFAYNRWIKSIRFSKNITHIGADAFKYCEELSEIILPENLTDLGACAFYACSNLKKLVINKKLTRIPGGAFYSNHSLEIIRIPKNVKYIGKKAFSGMNLKEIIIEKDYAAPSIIPKGFDAGWYESNGKNRIKITFVNV